MEAIYNEILKVFGYLIGAYLLYYIWNAARENAVGGNLKMVLWKGFLYCAGFALFASFTLGNPTCIDLEQDNRGDTCYEYADNGYQPTSDQRAAQFAYWLTLLYIPVIFGAYSGKNRLKNPV